MSAAPAAPSHLAETARFARRVAFQRAARAAVAGYFREKGVSRSGDRRLYLKALVLVAWFLLSYVALLVAARTWWQALALSLSVGWSAAAVGFNVHHDANHGAFATRVRTNRLVGLVLDLLGGSSYVWRRRHNYFHHLFTNLAGHDADIDGLPLLRMSPAQPWRWWHRYQHFYCWIGYTLFPLRWWFWDDYHDLFSGTIGGHHIARPRGWELAGVGAGKAVFLCWALLLPLALHPWPAVVACYLVASSVLGLCLALSAQLSHCLAETAFPQTAEVEWAVHQVRTCSGFSHGSRLANAFWGGLNFQLEHHLFPRVSHVHYPAIAPILKTTCAAFGLTYLEHATLGQALRSHTAMMRRAGRRQT